MSAICYASERGTRSSRLAGQGLDLPTFWRESSAVLARVVPHYMTPCWFTFDPSSLLVTSHFQPDVPELPPEWLAHEYYEDDVHKMADIARSERGYSTLHEATGGDPSRSPGWQPLHASLWRRSRSCSSPCVPGQEMPGACWVSIASTGESAVRRR